jgi:hypothetical protein
MRKMKHPTVARIITAMNSSVTTSAVDDPGISGCRGYSSVLHALHALRGLGDLGSLRLGFHHDTNPMNS